MLSAAAAAAAAGSLIGDGGSRHLYYQPVARDIVDDRLIGALHLRALTRAGLDHDPVHEHQVVQAGTIDALLHGQYDSDITLAEVMRLGDVGIGTIAQLDGELMILDGTAWVAGHDTVLRQVPLTTRTPFAVACKFSPSITHEVNSPMEWNDLTALIDQLAGSGEADGSSSGAGSSSRAGSSSDAVIAVRIHGEFDDIGLRSVARQTPPYPPLVEVVAHQTTWHVPSARGTLLGFRFPDGTAGVEVPGYHLHFLSDDRTTGGHVLSLVLRHGTVAVDDCDDLHVALPAGVELGTPGVTDRSAITSAEGDHG
jgi:acetolactate decarboxylase